jgi:hypothetical protein
MMVRAVVSIVLGLVAFVLLATGVAALRTLAAWLLRAAPATTVLAVGALVALAIAWWIGGVVLEALPSPRPAPARRTTPRVTLPPTVLRQTSHLSHAPDAPVTDVTP